MEKWIQAALDIGFDVAAPCDVSTLRPMTAVRDMCRADKCQAYGRSWMCPPNCGTMEDCAGRMGAYQNGLLLQTIGHMTKAIDSRCYRETERRHMENFLNMVTAIRREYPQALCLGAGGCRVCKACAFPEPCRFPERAYSSMEGYGLFVTQVCRDNGVAYHYGERTIAYSACILF